MKREIIEVHLISLKARLNCALGYLYNNDLKVECNLLMAQIKALEAELKKEEG